MTQIKYYRNISTVDAHVLRTTILVPSLSNRGWLVRFSSFLSLGWFYFWVGGFLCLLTRFLWCGCFGLWWFLRFGWLRWSIICLVTSTRWAVRIAIVLITSTRIRRNIWRVSTIVIIVVAVCWLTIRRWRAARCWRTIDRLWTLFFSGLFLLIWIFVSVCFVVDLRLYNL